MPARRRRAPSRASLLASRAVPAVVRAGGPSLRRAPSGQGLVEYGIILGLAALVIVLLLVVFDDQVAAVLAWLSGQLP